MKVNTCVEFGLTIFSVILFANGALHRQDYKDFECILQSGIGTGVTRVFDNITSANIITKQQCIDECLTMKIEKPDINGVTVSVNNAPLFCYCDHNVLNVSLGQQWETCRLLTKCNYFLRVESKKFKYQQNSSNWYQKDSYHQIWFRHITIMSGIMIKKVNLLNDVKVKFSSSLSGENGSFHYIGVKKNGTQDDYEYSTNETFGTDEKTVFWFHNPIRARAFRIHFKFDSDFEFKFKLYGCPFHQYAKPLGMSNGMITDSRFSVQSEKMISSPNHARLGGLGDGFTFWDLSQHRAERTHWLQISLPEVKKIMYITTFGREITKSYEVERSMFYVDYGLDLGNMRSLLSEDGSQSMESAKFQNTRNIFKVAVKAKYVRIIPYKSSNTDWRWILKFELFGVAATMPDHHWQMAKPYSFDDSNMYEDLRPSERLIAGESYLIAKNATKAPHLRTDEILNQDCIFNPDNCDDGISFSFWMKSPGTQQWDNTGASTIRSDLISQIHSCTSLASADILLSEEFALFIERFEVPRYQTASSVIRVQGLTGPNRQFHAKVFINQPKEFVIDCSISKASFPLAEGSVELTSGVFQLHDVVQTVLNSFIWVYGYSLSILLTPIVGEFMAVDGNKITKDMVIQILPQMITACSTHETDIVTQLPEQSFILPAHADCKNTGFSVKLTMSGFSSCTDPAHFVTVDLGKQYYIVSLKVAGYFIAATGHHQTTTKFVFGYSEDDSSWKTVENDLGESYVFERESFGEDEVEVIPLPNPVYAKFVALKPLLDSYHGEDHGYKFDIIHCILAPEKMASWLKLNQETVCTSAKAPPPANVVLKQNLDLSFIMLLHTNGLVSCNNNTRTSTRWGCTNKFNMVLTDSSSKLLGPYQELSDAQSYILDGFQPNSEQLQLKLRGARYFKGNDELNIWYSEVLFDFTTGDNIGATCFDVYGWGLPYLQRWLVDQNPSSQARCAYVDESDGYKLKMSNKCDQALYLTIEGYLVSAKHAKCVNCNTNACKLVTTFCTDDCTKFHPSITGFKVVEENLVLTYCDWCVGLKLDIFPTVKLGFTDNPGEVMFEVQNAYMMQNVLFGDSPSTSTLSECAKAHAGVHSFQSRGELSNFVKFQRNNYLISEVFQTGYNPTERKWRNLSPLDKEELGVINGDKLQQEEFVSTPGKAKSLCVKQTDSLTQISLDTEDNAVCISMREIKPAVVSIPYDLEFHTIKLTRLSGTPKCNSYHPENYFWSCGDINLIAIFIKNENNDVISQTRSACYYSLPPYKGDSQSITLNMGKKIFKKGDKLFIWHCNALEQNDIIDNSGVLCFAIDAVVIPQVDRPKPTSIPTFSAGLQLTNKGSIGNGFQISHSFQDKYLIEIAFVHNTSYCFGKVFYPDGKIKKWLHHAISYSTIDQNVIVLLDGDHVGTIQCASRKGFTKYELVFPSMTYFINIGSFYDHSFIYHPNDYSDIRLWRSHTSVEEHIKIFRETLITFSEHSQSGDTGWELQSSLCSENDQGPCEDIARKLLSINDIECEWISGSPISKKKELVGTVRFDGECFYECNQRRRSVKEINAASVLNDTCYCMFDMSSIIKEDEQGYRSCYIPVTVKYGIVADASSFHQIAINPINKMIYAIHTTENKLYRHPSRKSPFDNAWENVYNTPIKSFCFYKNELWVHKESLLAYTTNEKDWVYNRVIQSIEKFAVNSHTIMIISQTSGALVVFDRKDTTGDGKEVIAPFKPMKFLTSDAYAGTFITTYENDESKSEILTWVKNQSDEWVYTSSNYGYKISKILKSANGVTYILRLNEKVIDRNISSQYSSVGIGRYALALNDASDFAVDSDDYILVVSNGKVQQYPSMHVSKPDLYTVSTSDFTSNKAYCDDYGLSLLQLGKETDDIASHCAPYQKVWTGYERNTALNYEWADGSMKSYQKWCSAENDSPATHYRIIEDCISALKLSDGLIACEGKTDHAKFSEDGSVTSNLVISSSSICVSQYDYLVLNEQQHRLFTFQVSINTSPIIKKAVMKFTTDKAASLEKEPPIEFDIFLLVKNKNEIFACDGWLKKENFALIKPIHWSISEWKIQNIYSPDLSSLVQLAVNDDWFYGKEISFFLYMNEYSRAWNPKYNLKMTEVTLQILYNSANSNNFLHLIPDQLPYSSYDTSTFHDNNNYLSFWFYMLYPDQGTIFVWQICHLSNATPQLLFRNSKVFGKWELARIELSNSYGEPFKLRFLALNQPKENLNNIFAIDHITVSQETKFSITAEYVSPYDLSDRTSYLSVLTHLRLPSPILLLPLASINEFDKDYGVWSNHVLVVGQFSSQVDKYGFPNHSTRPIKDTSAIKVTTAKPGPALETFTILLHVNTEQSSVLDEVILSTNENNLIKFDLMIKNNKLTVRGNGDGNYSFETSMTNYWTYFAIVYENGILRLYYNNTLDSTRVAHLPLPFHTVDVFPVLEEKYSKLLSCVQFYNKSLSLHEIKALEFCPNRQDIEFHVECVHGVSVAFGDQQCSCLDDSMRYQTKHCENAFKKTIYNNSIYIPFDFINKSTDESGMVQLHPATSGFLELGPQNYAFCTQGSPVSIFKANFCNYLNCANVTNVGFWFKIQNKLTYNQKIKVFQYFGVVFDVVISNSWMESNKLIITWNHLICRIIEAPVDTWFYVFISYNQPNIVFYINGDFVATCLIDNIIAEHDFVVGPSSCIDEISSSALDVLRLAHYEDVTYGHMKKKWVKLNSDELLVKSRTDSEKSFFSLKNAMNLFRYKLVHIDGLIDCKDGEGSYWGCTLNNKFAITLTHENNILISSTEKFYFLQNYTIFDKTIEIEPKQTQYLPKGYEIKVWYTEVFLKHYVRNNFGVVVFDIYGLDGRMNENVFVKFEVTIADVGYIKSSVKNKRNAKKFVQDAVEDILLSRLQSSFTLKDTDVNIVTENIRFELNSLLCNVMISLTYLNYELSRIIHDWNRNPFTEHKGFKYSITKVDVLGVPSHDLQCNLKFLNSTHGIITVSHDDVEDKRFHKGFNLRVKRSIQFLPDQNVEILNNFDLLVGGSKFMVGFFKPFRRHDLEINSLTHLGYGPPCSLTADSPPSLNSVPPEVVSANCTNETAITVTWLKFDNITNWNSDRIKYGIFWKANVDNDTFNITSYNTLYQPMLTFLDYKTVSNGPTEIIYTITDLKPFTNYSILIATVNVVGIGAFKNVFCRTLESVPTGSPEIISAYSDSSTTISINVSLPVHEMRNGIIIGYLVSYHDERTDEIHEERFITDRINDILVLANLTKFTDYLLKVLAFTGVGDGPYSENFTVKTLEDVPSAGAFKFNYSEVTRGNITVKWENVIEVERHGILLYYLVRCNGSLRNGSLHEQHVNITFDEDTSSYTHTFAVFPHTLYNVTIQACTSRGCSLEEMVAVETLQTAPVGLINDLKQDNSTLGCLCFSWSDVYPMQKRGIVSYFKISYVLADWQWDYEPTIVFVPGDQLQVSIPNVANYSSYFISVSAVTEGGEGPLLENYLTTLENVPSVPPNTITAYNISSTGLNVKFDRLNDSLWQGILRGYYIYYRHADLPSICHSGQVCNGMDYKVCEGSYTNECEVQDLDLNTEYTVCVAAFTAAGPGPISQFLHATTDTYIDGGWTEWSKWGECDRSCGLGNENRLRFCVNPIPLRGGRNCTDHDIETRSCNDFPCSGFYLGNPLQDCDEVCNKIDQCSDTRFACLTTIKTKNSSAIFQDVIDVNNYKNFLNLTCNENDGDEREYSKTYHPAYDVQKHVCSGYAKVPMHIPCSSIDPLTLEYQRLCFCADADVYRYSEWASWSPCSRSCGGGMSRRFRSCNFESGCTKVVDIRDCNTQLCPIDGSWGPWSDYKDCSTACGYGRQTRTRQCDSPLPMFGGEACDGTSTSFRDGCNPEPCPVHGGWSSWSDYEVCSQPCGLAGIKMARRYCNNPAPKYNGRGCSGTDVKQVTCNQEKTCKRIGVTFFVQCVELTWHFMLHYTNAADSLKLQSNISAKVIETIRKSSVDLRVIEDIKFNHFSRGSVNVNFTVYFTGNSFIESLIIQNAIDNIGYLDDMLVQDLDISADTVPGTTPNFVFKDVTYSTISLSWEQDINWSLPTSLAAEFFTFYVFYRTASSSEQYWESLGTNDKSITIKGLDPGTNYGFRLVASINGGNGIASKEKIAKTLDGIPMIAPPNFLYQRITGYRVFLSWDLIPLDQIPGTLLGYIIKYTRRDTNKTETLITSAHHSQRTLVALKPARFYYVEIAGYTSTGTGPFAFLVFQSLHSEPGIAPPNIIVTDRLTASSIRLQWDPIPTDHQNGGLKGYKLKYRLIKEAGMDVMVGEKWIEKEFDEYTWSYTLDDLQAYGEYEIELQGFSAAGNGPSSVFIGKTCKCPGIIYTNYYDLQPFFYKDTLTGTPSGFFKDFIEEILVKTCTDCKSYKEPIIYFDRTLTGELARKTSQLDVTKSLGESAQLNMPIYYKFAYDYFAGKYPYIGLVRIQGSAAIIKETKMKTLGVWVLASSIGHAWPIVIMMFILSFLCGALLWFTERKSNFNDQKNTDTNINGPIEAVWTAVVTLTTVGYGDYLVRTNVSRFIILVWIMTGILSTSLFTAFVSSNLISSNIEEHLHLYGTPTAVVAGTAEHNLAILRNAQVLNFSTPMDVLNAVQTNIAQIGLLNSMITTSYLEDIRDKSLKVAKIFDTNSGYGLVLSAGLEVIHKDFQSYVLAQQSRVDSFVDVYLKQIEPNITVIESELLSKKDIATLITYSSLTYVVFAVVGISVWLLCKCRHKNKVESQDVSNDLRGLSSVVKTFYENFKATTERLDKKHLQQLGELECLQNNFIRFMTRGGLSKVEVKTKMDKKRQRDIKRILKYKP